MKFESFEHTFSADRMRKYVMACGGDTRRAMTLASLTLPHSKK